MSFIPGQVKIDNVSGGVVQFGASVFISPKHATKTTHGAGASNFGASVLTINGVNATNTLDTDVIDQPIINDN